MCLVCPSVQGAIVQKPRRRAATLPLFLGRTFQGSISFPAFGVAAVGKGLMVEKEFSWLIIGVECVVIRRPLRRLPSLSSANVHWGGGGVTGPTPPVIVGCSSYHSHLLHD